MNDPKQANKKKCYKIYPSYTEPSVIFTMGCSDVGIVTVPCGQNHTTYIAFEVGIFFGLRDLFHHFFNVASVTV